ncbi:MAG: PIN domain-containing protein [Deltaproteobacteria bacterium]|nr:PIN domain-containing protein [Deltaproteobacteria bacterium]
MLLDANLLLYAKLASYEQHHEAHAWLDERLNGRAKVGLPWPSLLAFMRLATNPRFFPRPLSMATAWAQVRDWLALPTTWVPTPTDAHADVLDGLVVGQGLTPKLVTDAHLAALAIEHGLVLCSCDADFARFEGLTWSNPLAPARR